MGLLSKGNPFRYAFVPGIPFFAAQDAGLFGSDPGPVDYSMAGAPGAPSYSPGFDPNTMSMAGDVNDRLNKIVADPRALNKFRGEALRMNPSSWARLQYDKQFADESNMKDRARGESAAATAGAESQLAARGGLSSGARERIARKGASDTLAMTQDVGRTGNMNRMQIDINDEQNRIQQLSQLPGMENNLFQQNMQKENLWEQARRSDIGNVTAENARRQSFNQNLYQQQMSAWAAQQQARATENSGKK